MSNDILKGHWDQVLAFIGFLNLRIDILHDLYEHILLELLEKGEKDICRIMIKECTVFRHMASFDPLSTVRLQRLSTLIESEDKRSDLYRGLTREQRRTTLSELVSLEVKPAKRGRLLKLIENGVRFEQADGSHTDGICRVDLLTGEVSGALLDENPLNSEFRTIRFPQGSNPESSVFTRDGRYLITGSSDGLVEAWDTETFRVAMDLEYQARGEFIVHVSSITAFAISYDGITVASGDKDGHIKVWDFESGRSHKHFTSTHRDGITSLCFSQDDSKVLSASLDKTARTHGLKSGMLMKEFAGHQSYVIGASFLSIGDVLTASSDGYIRVFSGSSCQLLRKFAPPPPAHLNASIPVPITGVDVQLSKGVQEEDVIFACLHSSVVCKFSLDGKVIQRFSSGRTCNDDFVSLVLSSGKSLLYVASENGNLYCFNTMSGELLNVLQLSKSGIKHLCHHPRKAIISSCVREGAVKFLGR